MEELARGEYLPMRRRAGYGDIAHAAWACPECGFVMLVGRSAHAIDVYGEVTPNIRCMASNCDFTGKLQLDEWVPEPRGQA